MLKSLYSSALLPALRTSNRNGFPEPRRYFSSFIQNRNLPTNPQPKGAVRSVTSKAITRRWMSGPESASQVLGMEAGQINQNDILLLASDDLHGGVTVEMRNPMDAQVFASLLRSSISHWRLLGKKGVWIKLPIELANLVEPAVQEGFYYHHAEPKYLMLARWLPETSSTLPANASHRVGVGAFVMNENKEVLVVQEKSGILRGMGVWKFPTGITNEGENICMAAVREVKEETGIDARFVEVLAFRESHKVFFQKSDLYVVCLLQPLTFDIQIQESEIEAAKWMPFEEYAEKAFVQKHELLRYITKICRAKMGGVYSGFSVVPIKASFREGNDFMYMNDWPLNN